jgi:chromosome partitioning protein
LKTIVLASRKGGAGKTTLTGHLACEADRLGLGPVVVMDTDPMGSLSEWWNERKMETPVFVRPGADGIAATLEELRGQGARLVFIDTPPANTTDVSETLAAADLVVIPAQPSPHDLRAIRKTVEMASKARKPMIFVVNGAPKGARVTSEAAVALSQHGTVSPVTVHQRVVFRTAMIDGRTAHDLEPGSAAADEIADLWGYIVDRMEVLAL